MEATASNDGSPNTRRYPSPGLQGNSHSDFPAHALNSPVNDVDEAAQRNEQRQLEIERENEEEEARREKQVKFEEEELAKKNFLYRFFYRHTTWWRDLSGQTHEAMYYLLFLMLFCTVVFAPRNSDPYFMKRSIEGSLLENSFTSSASNSSITFYDIGSKVEVFDWLEQLIVPEFNPVADYTGAELDRTSKGYLSGTSYNAKIGLLRLRVLRVADDSCEVATKWDRVITKCYASFSPATEEKKDFVLTDSSGEMLTLKWQSEDELDNFDYTSTVSKEDYPGSGYIIDLPNSLNGSLAAVRFLRRSSFLDDSSRALLIESSMYNPNVDLVASNTFGVEFLSTGTVLKSKLISCTPLFRSQLIFEGDVFSSFYLAMLVLEIALYVCVWCYIYSEYCQLREKGFKSYFGEFWNIFEAFNLTIFVVVMVARMSLLSEVNSLIDDAARNMGSLANEYVNFNRSTFIYLVIDNLNAFNSVIVFVKIFKFVRHNRKLAQFTDTLGLAAGEMGVLCVIIFAIVCGYSIGFHLGFGHELFDFRDFPESLLTLFRSALGDFEVQNMVNTNRILGPLLFVSFIIIMFFVIISMFLAIVDSSYEAVRISLLEELGEGNKDPFTQDMEYLAFRIKKFGRFLAEKIVGKEFFKQMDEEKERKEREEKEAQEQAMNVFDSIDNLNGAGGGGGTADGGSANDSSGLGGGAGSSSDLHFGGNNNSSGGRIAGGKRAGSPRQLRTRGGSTNIASAGASGGLGRTGSRAAVLSSRQRSRQLGRQRSSMQDNLRDSDRDNSPDPHHGGLHAASLLGRYRFDELMSSRLEDLNNQQGDLLKLLSQLESSVAKPSAATITAANINANANRNINNGGSDNNNSLAVLDLDD